MYIENHSGRTLSHLFLFYCSCLPAKVRQHNMWDARLSYTRCCCSSWKATVKHKRPPVWLSLCKGTEKKGSGTAHFPKFKNRACLVSLFKQSFKTMIDKGNTTMKYKFNTSSSMQLNKNILCHQKIQSRYSLCN